MSSPPVPTVQPSNTLGTDWVNIISAQDHTALGPAFYCEIHLRVDLASEDVLNQLKRTLDGTATTEPEIQSKQTAVIALLKAELNNTNRANVSTVAIVEAIKLRS